MTEVCEKFYKGCPATEVAVQYADEHGKLTKTLETLFSQWERVNATLIAIELRMTDYTRLIEDFRDFKGETKISLDKAHSDIRRMEREKADQADMEKIRSSVGAVKEMKHARIWQALIFIISALFGAFIGMLFKGGIP